MVDIEIVTRSDHLWSTIYANTYDGMEWIKKAGIGYRWKGAALIPQFLVTDYLLKIKSSQLKVKIITYE